LDRASLTVVRVKMICGIGIDIVEVARVKESIDEYGQRYLEKMFTPGEIRYCHDVPISTQRYAARLAAKEAAMKALGTGWDGVDWKDFEVLNEDSGQPRLLVHGRAAELLKERSISRTWVSLSHDPTYTIAQVVFEREGGD
jgi:holo-[acyl-carrier protein] synthase